MEILPGRLVPLSPRRPLERGADGAVSARDETIVNRLLPQRHRRMVGAWCFVDHYGPDDISASRGMDVAPHPHSGLQTVSWLIEGTVLHQDSVGSVQTIEPGGLGLMTSGRAISHSEESPADRPAMLHGIQLWVALPAEVRGVEPAWEYHPHAEEMTLDGGTARVFMGTLGDVTAPATTHSPIVGAEVRLQPGAQTSIPVRSDFEYAVVVFDGAVTIDDTVVEPGFLAYLGAGLTTLDLDTADGAGFLLLGGEPFEEAVVMWWNFIGRSHDDVVAMRDAWMATLDDRGGEYGTVEGYDGDWTPAPPLPSVRLRSRGRTA